MAGLQCFMELQRFRLLVYPKLLKPSLGYTKSRNHYVKLLWSLAHLNHFPRSRCRPWPSPLIGARVVLSPPLPTTTITTIPSTTITTTTTTIYRVLLSPIVQQLPLLLQLLLLMRLPIELLLLLPPLAINDTSATTKFYHYHPLNDLYMLVLPPCPHT